MALALLPEKLNLNFSPSKEFPRSTHHTGFHSMIRNPHPKKERHGDCGTRAICLALGIDYQTVWNAATKMKQMNAPTYCYNYGGGYVEYKKSKATATWGLSKRDLMDTLSYLGIDNSYTCLKTFDFKFNKENVPPLCIAHLPRHWVAVRDGAIWDSYDSRGTRPRKLRGYVMFNKDDLARLNLLGV
tara:strand:+ start:968 stop:1525 length:558 start_codon:yes stop_codon:yes gene_type:complete